MCVSSTISKITMSDDDLDDLPTMSTMEDLSRYTKTAYFLIDNIAID